MRLSFRITILYSAPFKSEDVKFLKQQARFVKGIWGILIRDFTIIIIFLLVHGRNGKLS